MKLRMRTSLAATIAVAAFGSGSALTLPVRQARPASDPAAGLAVDFIAVLENGALVGSLQSSEVEVRLDGRLKPVRSLRIVTAEVPAAAPGAPARTRPPFGTNAGVPGGRSFALVIDQESFTAGREQALRKAVEGLLHQLSPADRTMVAALPYGGVRQAFTGEVDRIRQAMAELSGQGNSTETGSDLACRTRRFLESLDGFLQAQSHRVSPLTVILFTAGLAAPRRDAPMALAPGMCELLVDDFRRVSTAAGAARANFYLVHPDDIAMGGAIWKENIAGVGSLGSDNPLLGIEHLAGVTGGARFPLDAAGTGALVRIARESSAYYVADVQPESGEVFGRSRSLSVRVLRRGVTVRARPAITFTERAPRSAPAPRTLADVLVSSELFTDLQLRAAGFTVREPGGRLRVGVVVEAVDPGAALASVGAILVGGDGRIAGRWSAADASKRPILGAMAAPPGTYRLRAAAIDAAGRIGAAEELVDVGLTSIGPLSLGSLLIGASGPEGLVPRLEFAAEPTAIVSFDIYGGSETTRLSARLELARSTDGPPLVAVPLVLARADADRVTATGSAPIGALPPGDYVVRGIIQLEDGTTGRVVRTLRKTVK